MKSVLFAPVGAAIVTFAMLLSLAPSQSKSAPAPAPADGTEVVDEVIDVERVWSGHSVGFSLLTHGDNQYAAYYDANRRMTVATPSCSPGPSRLAHGSSKAPTTWTAPGRPWPIRGAAPTQAAPKRPSARRTAGSSSACASGLEAGPASVTAKHRWRLLMWDWSKKFGFEAKWLQRQGSNL